MMFQLGDFQYGRITSEEIIVVSNYLIVTNVSFRTINIISWVNQFASCTTKLKFKKKCIFHKEVSYGKQLVAKLPTRYSDLSI